MRAFLLVLMAVPVLALDNAKTIQNRTGASLSNHPFTLHYYFAKGDISSYPRPFLTPGTTGVREAAAEWQADVKSRWRDGSATRTITGVRTIAPSWTTSGGGLVNIVESNDTATINWSSAHGLRVGDRLQITGATGDADLNRDHYIVHSVPTATSATVRTQNVSNATYSQSGLTVHWVIDPAARSHCWIESAGHGFETGEQVTIAGVNGVPGANGTWYVTAAHENRFLINTTCSGAYTGGGTATGPDYGSVQTAHVSFTGTVPASGSLRVDIANSTTPCHLGDLATCRAAGLDKSGMLGFLGGAWDAQLDLTALVKTGSTATITRNVRTMLSAWDGTESYCGPRYWLRGPVVTQLILEYGCEGATTYDAGWKPVPGLTLGAAVSTTDQTAWTVDATANIEPGSLLWIVGTSNNIELAQVDSITDATNIVVTRGYGGTTPQTYASGKKFGVLQYTDAPDGGFQSIRPKFALKFYTNWSGVEIQTQVDNSAWSKYQTVYYAPAIRTGPALDTRWSAPQMRHPNRARWRKTFWSGASATHGCDGGGTDPDNCPGTGGGTRAPLYRVDHNTDYLIYAGALQPHERFSGTNVIDWWANSSQSNRGFNTSDLGDVGVDPSSGSAYVRGVSQHPLKRLGAGTWGSDNDYSWYAEVNMPNGTQEGGPLPRVLAQWIFTWDDYGHDIVFGDQVTGGGGNSEAQEHMPYAAVETAPGRGAYVAGWDAPAFNRPISTHNRPSVATQHGKEVDASTTTLAVDQPLISCYTSSSAPYSSSVSSTASSWPCYFRGTTQGYDGWSLEMAHMNDWTWLPWLITGEEYYWQGLLRRASFAAGYGHAGPVGRNIGKIWGASYSAPAQRMEAWGTLSMVHAWAATPTEPLFGLGKTTPEKHLLNAYLWDMGMFQEGILDITGGWASILYAPSFSTDCSVLGAKGSANLHLEASSNRYLHGRCTIGESPNPLRIYQTDVKYFGACTGVVGGMDCNESRYGVSHYMNTYSAVTNGEGAALGSLAFQHSLRGFTQGFVNGLVNADTNGFLQGYYTIAFWDNATDLPAATWARWKSLHTASAQALNSWSGVGGSTALPVGYSYRLLSAVAQAPEDYVDRTTPGCAPPARPGGCSAALAYDWLRQTLEQQSSAAYNNKYFLGKRPAISGLRIQAGGAAALARFVAPDGGACSYYLGTAAPADSLGSLDTAIAAGPRERVLPMQGLNPWTEYHLRITCGKARISSVFTTSGPGAPAELEIRRAAPAGCGTECHLRLEHSSDGESWSGGELTPCAAGCRLKTAGLSGELKLIRVTYYSDALGTLQFGAPLQQALLLP